MDRKLPILFVPDILKKTDRFLRINGEKVNNFNLRLKLFRREFNKHDTVKCECCGAEAAYFALERHNGDSDYHLNLYAIDGNGIDRLLTKDHKYPLSKMGKNILQNLQVLCSACNQKKANKPFIKFGKKIND